MAKNYVLNSLITPGGDGIPQRAASETPGYTVSEYVRVAPLRTPSNGDPDSTTHKHKVTSMEAPNTLPPADYTVLESVNSHRQNGPVEVADERAASDATNDGVQEAKARYQDRLVENPGDLWALNNLALIALRQNDPEAALDYAQQALYTQAEVADTLFAALAVSLAHLDQRERAESIARRGIEIREAVKALAAEVAA